MKDYQLTKFAVGAVTALFTSAASIGFGISTMRIANELGASENASVATMMIMGFGALGSLGYVTVKSKLMDYIIS